LKVRPGKRTSAEQEPVGRRPPAHKAAGKKSGRGRRIALFGGTFDPIHLGHLAVARAAMRRFNLDRVFFIPSANPPHKPASELLPFAHRFAMVSLACAVHPRFIPSLAEGEVNGGGARDSIYYSVDTVRRFQQEFCGPGDCVFFLMGADSFLDIQAWKDYETFLGLCDFVVAHRPGFPSDSFRRVIPPELLADAPAQKKTSVTRSIALKHTTVYLLDTVDSDVSATAVRQRLDRGRSILGLVPASVEEYIKKQVIYQQP
jgi:nicotinate-nucleotide adenylyltransferase